MSPAPQPSHGRQKSTVVRFHTGMVLFIPSLAAMGTFAILNMSRLAGANRHEQSADAAESLKLQAEQLVQIVATFRLAQR